MKPSFDSVAGLIHDLSPQEQETMLRTENRPSLKRFLVECMKSIWHRVTYDQSVGLVPLIERAVGRANLNNINRDITQKRFPLKGTSVRSVKCRVEAYLDGETSEQAAKRLTDAGHVLASTGDLAGYLHDYPEEVAKWSGWVLAISEDSRWSFPDGFVVVPYAYVLGAYRLFDLDDFRNQFDSIYGVLVLSE